MSHLLFHRLFIFHPFRCDPALSVFASKCQGECYALMAALCDLGILAGGIPGFRIELCCFYHPLAWPPCGSVFDLFDDFSVAIFIMTHKMSSCMLFSLLVAIPLLCCFCLFLVVVLRVLFACFLLFVFWFLVWFLVGTARWTAYRSITSTFVAIDKLTALHENYNSSVN